MMAGGFMGGGGGGDGGFVYSSSHVMTSDGSGRQVVQRSEAVRRPDGAVEVRRGVVDETGEEPVVKTAVRRQVGDRGVVELSERRGQEVTRRDVGCATWCGVCRGMCG